MEALFASQTKNVAIDFTYFCFVRAEYPLSVHKQALKMVYAEQNPRIHRTLRADLVEFPPLRDHCATPAIFCLLRFSRHSSRPFIGTERLTSESPIVNTAATAYGFRDYRTSSLLPLYLWRSRHV